MSIEEFRNLTKKLRLDGFAELVVVYVLEKLRAKPSKIDIDRIAGAPIGVSKEMWPVFDGEKMEHVITIDVVDMPELRTVLKPGTRAIALFVSELAFNEAFQRGTPESALLQLTDEDIARGVSRRRSDPEAEVDPPPPRTFTCHRLEVPVAVFRDDLPDDQEHRMLVELRAFLCSVGLVGGKPMWIQSPEHDGQILLQFNENLVDMNLGDAGRMYVFADTAFWQCH